MHMFKIKLLKNCFRFDFNCLTEYIVKHFAGIYRINRVVVPKFSSFIETFEP